MNINITTNILRQLFAINNSLLHIHSFVKENSKFINSSVDNNGKIGTINNNIINLIICKVNAVNNENCVVNKQTL